MITTSRLLPAILLTGALFGCSSDDSSIVRAPSEVHQKVVDGASEKRVDLLGKGIALALADAALRRQVLEDFRDSPFREHGIHLSSYLSASRGRQLAQPAALAVGITTEELIDIARSVPDLALLVPIAYDRTRWTGSDDIVIVATAVPKSRWGSLTLPGYDVAGTAGTVPVQRRIPQVLIAIYPAAYPFGPDPEARRAAAPKQNRRTISTPEEEVGAQILDPCDGTNCGGGDGTSGGNGYNLGSDCNSTGIYEVTSSNDLDRDGLKDECEYRLAYAFRPMLVRHVDENCWPNEPYWTVHKNGYVTIGYLLSYHEDCGSLGHQGDSEWLLVKVGTPKTDYWNTHSVTTSAHWGTANDQTQENPFDQLQWVDSAGGRAYIYAARNKHANYENESRCDATIGDECSPNYGSNTASVYVTSDRNIGRASYPFDIDPDLGGYPPDCTKSKADPVNRYAIECYLQGDVTVNEFAGWSPYRSDASTHYREVLKYYGLFD